LRKRTAPASLGVIAVGAWAALSTGLPAAAGAPRTATPPSPTTLTNTPTPTDSAVIRAALIALGGADLIVVDDPVPGRPPSALVATRAPVSPAALAATLSDPRAYRDAIPSLVRAEVVGRRRASSTAPEDQLLEWELEIPLFNLRGKAWVIPRPEGIDLVLVEGDLAPGRLAFSWIDAPSPPPSSAGTILVLEAQVNMRAAGWIFRRVAARSPFGESAMNVAAAYVVLRAATLRAQHPADAGARRPRGNPAPPTPAALTADVATLAASPALDPLRRRGAIAAVRPSTATGRLATTTVAAPISLDAAALAARLATPDSWLALPGWHRVKPLAGDRVALKDNLPLVDFDTVWQLSRDRAAGFTARATDGATRGALFAWDVRPATAPAGARGSIAIFSLYPRLETAGYVPRKFIAAEPLLEHGMALALAYVDAMSMARALTR
jgi:hypothetical protein